MLKLKNITKAYVTGDTTVMALKGVDIEFRKCEFVSILGQSGCGNRRRFADHRVQLYER